MPKEKKITLELFKLLEMYIVEKYNVNKETTWIEKSKIGHMTVYYVWNDKTTFCMYRNYNDCHIKMYDCGNKYDFNLMISQMIEDIVR